MRTKIILINSVIFLISSLISTSLTAATYTAFDLSQSNQDHSNFEPVITTFNRQLYPLMGLSLIIHEPSTLKLGDTISFQWKNVDTGVLYSDYPMVLQNIDISMSTEFPIYCFTTNNPFLFVNNQCFSAVPHLIDSIVGTNNENDQPHTHTPDELSIFLLNTTYENQCMPEGNYQLEVLENGLSTGINLPFSPSLFQPGSITVSAEESSLYPNIPTSGIAPGILNVSGKVEDNIVRSDSNDEMINGQNCKMGVKDAVVTLSANISDNNGSHKHFNGIVDVGTGTFQSSVPTWTGIRLNKTEIDVSSDSNGEFTAKYKAGYYGLTEKMDVATPNLTTGENIQSTIGYDIKVPDLIPLDDTGFTYTLRGSYATSCDIQHNNDATGVGMRRSHYVTPTTYIKVQQLHNVFFTETDVTISVNDASLNFGGFFDNGTGRFIDDGVMTFDGIKCHKSHRTGKDFDVNTGKRWWYLTETGELVDRTEGNREIVTEIHPDCFDAGGNNVYLYNLNCQIPYGSFDALTVRRDILDKMARFIGLDKIREATIHYRSDM